MAWYGQSLSVFVKKGKKSRITLNQTKMAFRDDEKQC